MRPLLPRHSGGFHLVVVKQLLPGNWEFCESHDLPISFSQIYMLQRVHTCSRCHSILNPKVCGVTNVRRKHWSYTKGREAAVKGHFGRIGDHHQNRKNERRGFNKALVGVKLGFKKGGKTVEK